MSKPVVGMIVGAVLGALDGLSAWLSPEARPIMVAIVVGSTLKGVITGLLAGLIGRWTRSVTLGALAGLVIGFALSSVAAIGQPGHYWEIVLPGMLVGAMVGFVTQRYPHRTARARAEGSAMVIVLAVVSPIVGSATWQSPTTPDTLASVAPLVGRWIGTTEGQPGKGTVERDYERVLGDRFIRVRNRSTYPPQEKNPRGETHQDEGFFSFDRARKRVVFRQFHIEGFVNQYVEDSSSSPKSVVLVSEALENIPAGFKARETYVILGPDEVEEVFELAESGMPFEVYSRTRLERVKD